MKEEIQKILTDAMNIFFEKTKIRADVVLMHQETLKMPIFDDIRDWAKENKFTIAINDDIQIGIVIFESSKLGFVSNWNDFISFEQLFKEARPGVEENEDLPEVDAFDSFEIKFSIIRGFSFGASDDPIEFENFDDIRAFLDSPESLLLKIDRILCESEIEIGASVQLVSIEYDVDEFRTIARHDIANRLRDEAIENEKIRAQAQTKPTGGGFKGLF
jgi:hypothetical protein